jgi:2-oxoglutarate dehydrogenase E2 component (dihydrolipoamide succinyltransferase)
MPKMGESVNEGTIIKWHKKVGDIIKLDEIIFEISTDKVDTEIPAPAEGTLTEIIVKEGETVEVDTVVARIQSTSEENIIPAPINGDNKLVVETKPDPVVREEEKIIETSSTLNSNSGNVIEIAMPKMGESVMEGTIIKWYKKVGDSVKKDEMIFEISTDKVDTEIPSPQDGSVLEILVGEQETVEVGTIVAKLSVGSGVKDQVSQHKDKDSEKAQEQVQVKEVESMHENFGRDIDIRPKVQGVGSAFYSPLVLSIAKKESVSFDELQSIAGTGHEGRVTKKDILTYINARKKQQTQNVQVQDQVQSNLDNKVGSPAISVIQSTSKTFYNEVDVERIPMDNIRQKIMDHMVHSRDTSVHVTELIEVDMTRIHNFITAKKDEIMRNENAKITYMAFIADAVVKSLKKYPLVNSSIDGNTILQKKFINLGIAVAIEPTGLIVPNIKGAGDRNVIGLAKAIADLAIRSRTKKLTPDDISNGTFTITNYGVFGTIFGTPIINQPEVAILGVGVVQKKPVVIEVDGSDTFAVRNIMALTLSHDHRLVDGMLGGLFLKNIKDTLENFEGEI